MRILAIEDEGKVSKFVVRGLTAERFAVDVPRDGKSGWELCFVPIAVLNPTPRTVQMQAVAPMWSEMQRGAPRALR